MVCFSPRSRVEITGGYYEYIDVSSCQDIIHLYHLLWSATILNIVGLFLGIITAAVLGGFKDMVREKATFHFVGLSVGKWKTRLGCLGQWRYIIPREQSECSICSYLQISQAGARSAINLFIFLVNMNSLLSWGIFWEKKWVRGTFQTSHSLSLCKQFIIPSATLSVETFLVSFLLNGLWETMKEKELMFNCR